MPLSISEYLAKNGAVEVLCAIEPGGSRFEDILQNVSISRSTLSDRLAQGRDADLLELKAVSGERGAKHAHQLTHKGGILWFKLNTLGVKESYQVYTDARKRFEKKTEELQAWVADDPDTLEEPNIGLDELYRAIHLDTNPLPDQDSPDE